MADLEPGLKLLLRAYPLAGRRQRRSIRAVTNPQAAWLLDEMERLSFVRFDMLNLMYHGAVQPTVDEKVYAKLSERMRDRFDIFGTLPDVIDDEWIEDEERLDEELKNYTIRRARANAFDLRYASDVVPTGERWELCSKVLARNDVKKRLSKGWGERDRPEN